LVNKNNFGEGNLGKNNPSKNSFFKALKTNLIF